MSMSDDFQQKGGSPWGAPPGGGGSGILYKDTGNVRYSCENKTVEISKGPDGKNYIVKIVE